MSLLVMICIIAAVCSIAYGVCIQAVGSGTRFYLVWMVLAALLVLIASGIQTRIWKVLPEIINRLLLIGTVLFALSFFIIEGLIIRQMKQKEPPALDYILVLGAQMRLDGPSAVLRYRLDKAAAYLTDNPDTFVIVSGGKGANEPCSEAKGMQEYLIACGIQKERIQIEDQSKTTAENIKNSKSMLPPDAAVGLVTNNFHMFRALQLAKREGLTGVSGICAPSKAFYLPNNMLREYFAEIKLLVTFWTF